MSELVGNPKDRFLRTQLICQGTFVSRVNEFAKHGSSDPGKTSQIRSLLFDISFLMLCHVTQVYGMEVRRSNYSGMIIIIGQKLISRYITFVVSGLTVL